MTLSKGIIRQVALQRKKRRDVARAQAGYRLDISGSLADVRHDPVAAIAEIGIEGEGRVET